VWHETVQKKKKKAAIPILEGMLIQANFNSIMERCTKYHNSEWQTILKPEILELFLLPGSK